MDIALDTIDHMLIDRWQRDLPLTAFPFTAIGVPLGLDETAVIARLDRFVRTGLASRIGAVLVPNTIGASTLAALSVAAARIGEVAEIVNSETGVNHNYEREHEFNMWFVVTGADRHAVDATLRRIERRTGLAVLDLPMQCAYHIDLGFPINGSRAVIEKTRQPPCSPDLDVITPDDRALLVALEDGLPLVSRPYLAIGERLGVSEGDVISRLAVLLEAGIIRRLGIVVRHRVVGFSSNAMAVWNVPEDAIDEVGSAFAAHPSVTLCYRRRTTPDWPYGLFVMVHARQRAAALAVIAELNERNGTGALPHKVLFSRRCFKQRGARLRSERQVA